MPTDVKINTLFRLYLCYFLIINKYVSCLKKFKLFKYWCKDIILFDLIYFLFKFTNQFCYIYDYKDKL